MTVQCTLFASGEVLVVLEDIRDHNDVTGSLPDRLLIGISSGQSAANATPLDLSAILSSSVTQVGTPPFESYGVGELDLSPVTPVLRAFSRPVTGSVFDLQIVTAPADATSGYYLIGFEEFATPVPLDVVVGLRQPCSLRVNPVLTAVAQPATSPGVFLLESITIPLGQPSILGLQIFVQGATAGAQLVDTLALSNTLRGTIGDI